MKRSIVLITALFLGLFQLQAQVVFNEVQTSNSKTVVDSDFKSYADWIEIYNVGSGAVNVGGYYITDDQSTPRKWQIPEGTTIAAKGYLMIWCDGMNQKMHTNFRLSSAGEKIYMYSANMLRIDDVEVPEVQADFTYGRVTNGTGTWGLLSKPTPNAANVSTLVMGAAPAPTFSKPGGFYSSNQQVELFSTIPGAVIRYTLDGSEPTESSPIYSLPLSAEKTRKTTLKYGYDGKDNTQIQRYEYPSSLRDVDGYYEGNRDFAYVIKAKVFHEDYLPSKTVASTYFINMRKPDLPVVSLTTDRAGFFSADQGIYIQGTNGVDVGKFEANWEQDDWERQVFIEYYDENGEIKFGVNAGAQVMGGESRNNDQKSLKIVMRNKYESGEINYPIFGEDGLQTYKSFLLRNSGNDWTGGTMARDAAIQEVLRDPAIDLELQAYKPVVMYLNGEYFGLINMRERFDEEYFAGYNEGVSSKNIDLLKISGGKETFLPSEGDNLTYEELIKYLEVYDLAEQKNYEFVKNKYVDVDNTINYYIAQTYCQNTDWPENNARIWRPREANGKFRFPLYDTDFGYGLWGGGSGENGLNRILSSSFDEQWAVAIFKALMKNEEFESEFIQRYAYMINTTYDPARFEIIANRIENLIKHERDGYSDKEWTREVGAGYNGPYSTDDMINWAEERPNEVRGHIDSRFGYKGYSDLTVDFKNTQGGVYLCGLPVDDGYTGKQYNSTPIRLTAEPKDGYEFSKWTTASGTTLSTDLEYLLTIEGDYSIKAVFKARSEVSGIYINELMASNKKTFVNELGKTPDWIEIYNTTSKPIDLAGLYISDNSNWKDKYMIPYGSADLTTVEAGGYLLLYASGDAKDGANHLNFKLSSSGDTIFISQKNAAGVLSVIDEITYGTQNTDISFGRFPDASDNAVIFPLPTPETSNTIQATVEVDGLKITEFMASNGATIKEETGTFADWIEIYNTTSKPIDLGGLYITDDIDDPNKYMIPKTNPAKTTVAAGGYIVLWADNQTAIGENHLDFSLKAEIGDVAIVQLRGQSNYFIDQVSYTNQGRDIAYGRYPESSSVFKYLPTSTPGEANSNFVKIPKVSGVQINEILATNNAVVQDETGRYEDYIEFYNSGSQAINLAGLFVSDSLNHSLKYRIPTGNSAATTVQPGEWITFWASGDDKKGIMHLDFKLDGLNGENVVLSQVTENGIQQIDFLKFVPQTANISYGQSPENSDNWKLMSPTYNAQNVSSVSSVDLVSLKSTIGTISPNYAPGTFKYVNKLPLEAVGLPVISAVALNPKANVKITQATDLDGKATVEVISANGTATATYTVSFEAAASTDATLASLEVPGATLSPAFSNTVSTYNLSTQNSLVPLVSAIPNDPNAMVDIQYASSLSGNTVITVTASAGNVNTYILSHAFMPAIVNSWADNHNDNVLENWESSSSQYTLTETNEELHVDFYREAYKGGEYSHFDYKIPNEYILDISENPVVKIDMKTPKGINCDVRIDLVDADGRITNKEQTLFAVKGGKAYKTYTFDFTNKLEDGGYGGNPGSVDASNIKEIYVILEPGENNELEDKELYFDNLVIGKAKSNDANLASLTASAGSLSPEFNENTTSYTLTLPAGTTIIPTISAIKTNAKATMELIQPNNINGQAIVRVVAEDLVTIKSYTVDIVRTPETVEGYTDFIINPSLAGFTENSSLYSFTYSGDKVDVKYNRTGANNDYFTYNSVDANATIVDISKNPYVAIQVKSTTSTDIRIDVVDGSGNTNAGSVEKTVAGAGYVTHIFDFTGKLSGVDATDIQELEIYFDEGSSSFNSGIITIEKIMFGSHVDFVTNNAPVISSIPNQTILEGQTFNKILLNNYVIDDNTPDAALVWSTSGEANISVSINNNIATVTATKDWIGSEIVTFTVEDAEGETKTTDVTFTVAPNVVPVSSVAFTQSSVSIAKGKTENLYAYLNVLPANATVQNVSWETTSSSVSIDEDGNLTNNLEWGTETIAVTVTIEDKSSNIYEKTIEIVLTGCPTELAAVTLSPSVVTITEGFTQQLTAEYTPANACLKSVSYESNDETVATVDDSGLITAVAPGTATITITVDDGFSVSTATKLVTVEMDCSGDIVLSLNKTEIEIVEGTSETLFASITPENECTKDLKITWESSNEDVVIVTEGVVSGVAPGTAFVTATTTGNGTTTATCEITVTENIVIPTEPTSIALPKSIEIFIGDEETLTPVILPVNALNKSVTWSVVDEKIATVVDGVVIGISEGTTVVSVETVNGIIASTTVDVAAIEVESVTLSSTSLDMFVNDVETLTATILPVNATDQTIVWTSSNSKVATVVDGEITAIAKGSAIIKVQSSGISYAQCVVMVEDIMPTSVSLFVDATEMEVDQTQKIDATILPATVTNSNLTWTSTDNTIVEVDKNGNITAVNPGTATITSTADNGIFEEIEITVNNVLASSISLNATDVVITITETQQLVATILPANTTDQTITWSSSNPEVATVDKNGKVLGESVGTATITATTSNGLKASCGVEITTNIVPLESVTLSQESVFTYIGAHTVLSAEIAPANATNKSLVWKSSRVSVATVDQNGKIVAKSEGTAIITAESSNGKKGYCEVTVLAVSATDIILSKETLFMEVDETETLSATLVPDTTTNKTIVWNSSNENVATVENGVVTAIKIGKAVITASSPSGPYKECVVTVEDVMPTEVTISTPNPSMQMGEEQTLNVDFEPANVTNKNLTWKSNDTDVVTVTKDGTITAVGIGTATITVTTANGLTDTYEITVSGIMPTSISLNVSNVTIGTDETQQLIAEILPASATETDITWSSTKPNFATVNENGLVEGVAAGQTVIVAKTANGLVASCIVTVEENIIEPTSISLTETDVTLEEGKKEQLLATVLPADATNKSVVWTSNNTDVATVSQSGRITAIAEGTATITATTSNGVEKTCAVTVTPVLATSVSISPKTLVFTDNEKYTVTANITPANASNKTIVWSVENESIARVTKDGVVTSVAVGETRLFATTSNGVKASIAIDVKAVPVYATNIEVNLPKTTINIKESILAEAIITPANTTDKSVTWSVLQPAIATIDQTGEITGVSAGTTKITATTSNGIEATATITVNADEATSVSINQKSLVLDVDDKLTLQAIVLPVTTTNKSVTWQSNNKDAVIVNSQGEVTAVGSGSATITATTTNGLTAKCNVYVTAIEAESLTFINTDFDLLVADSKQMEVAFEPSNTTETDLIWISSNPDVATVDKNGTITAVGSGTAIITAMADNGVSQATTITVYSNNQAPALVTQIDDQQIERGNVFKQIDLKNYFTDDNTSVEDLEWSVSKSSNDITVQINSEGIVSAYAMSSTWTGSVDVKFYAIDEQDARTSCVVTYSITNRVGIDDIEAQEVKLYPNPCTNNCVVKLRTLIPANFVVSIYNAQGSMVFKKQIVVTTTHSEEINVSSFAKGVYTVVVSNGTTENETKLMVR